MINTDTSEMSVKVFFNENGEDADKILMQSLMLMIQKEVEKLCKKNS